MDGRRIVPSNSQTICNFASNAAIATCLIIEAPLEHAQYDVVVTDSETFDLSLLPIIEEQVGRLQLVERAVSFTVKDSMDRRVKYSVYVQN